MLASAGYAVRSAYFLYIQSIKEAFYMRSENTLNLI